LALNDIHWLGSSKGLGDWAVALFPVSLALLAEGYVSLDWCIGMVNRLVGMAELIDPCHCGACSLLLEHPLCWNS